MTTIVILVAVYLLLCGLWAWISDALDSYAARTPRAQQQAACERLRAWVGRRA